MHSLFHRMRRWLGLILSLTCLMASARADDASPPASGTYCPAPQILYVIVEELSVSLDQLMAAQGALRSNDAAAAELALGRAASALALASARGGGARTARLFDAVAAAKAGEDYAHMLGWFPALRAALLSLPDSPVVRYAGTELGVAESILQGDRDGDALEHLHAARDYLSCSALDIPLKQADAALVTLYRKLAQGGKLDADGFNAVATPLRSALDAALEQSQAARLP